MDDTTTPSAQVGRCSDCIARFYDASEARTDLLGGRHRRARRTGTNVQAAGLHIIDVDRQGVRCQICARPAAVVERTELSRVCSGA